MSVRKEGKVEVSQSAFSPMIGTVRSSQVFKDSNYWHVRKDIKTHYH
jgi:hypothetical protein